MYRFLSLALAVPALLLSGLHGIRVRSPRQVVLRTAKSTAQGLAAVLAVSGLLGSVLGWLARSPLAILAGLAGGLLSARYILRVQAAARQVQHEMDLPALPTSTVQAGPETGPLRQRERFTPGLTPSSRRLFWYRQELRREDWRRDLPYCRPSGTAPLHCDLWLPPETTQPSGTVIVYLHGGGFFTSSKDFGTRAFFRHLAGQGHAVMDADYRLAPGATLIEMQADARRAIHWIKQHAVDYDYKPQRVVLAGGSAGGLLALLVAYTPYHPLLTPPDLEGVDLNVQSVISYYGVVDLAGLYLRLAEVMAAPRQTSPAQAAAPGSTMQAALLQPRLLDAAARLGAWLKGVEPGAMRQYLQDNAALMDLGLERAFTRLVGITPSSDAQELRLLSPSTHVGAHCPPTLLVHGEHDYLLPAAATRALAGKLREYGTRVVYLELPQTEHTFDLFLPAISPPAIAALSVVDHFLVSLAET